MSGALTDLKVGDQVALLNRGILTAIRPIDRITATQIIVYMWRFRRSDFREVGARSGMSIARPTQEHFDLIEIAAHLRWLRGFLWGRLSLEALRKVVATAKAAMEEDQP